MADIRRVDGAADRLRRILTGKPTPRTTLGVAGPSGPPHALPDAGTPRPAPSTSTAPDLIASLVLVTALAAGLFRQGAFFADGQWSMGLLVCGAALVAASGQPLSGHDLRRGPAPFLLAVGGWAVADGALHRAVRAGLPAAALAAGIVAVLAVCRRLAWPHRQALLGGLVVAAVAVAAAGWVGVAYHLAPWGLQAQGLWRAASTLTYPNAAAAVLVPVSLLTVAALTERRRWWLGLAATGLLVGTGATLSRAGLLGLAVGAGVLAALLGLPAVLRAGWAPALGAAVALVGLMPSVPVQAAASPLTAAAALVAGLAVGGWAGRLPGRAALPGAGLVAALGWIASGRFGRAAAQIVGTRATAASPDRTHGLRAAFGVFADHPLTGAGPGLARLHWTDAGGVGGTLRYAHDEYVQVAADLGLVGVALLVALLAAIALLLRRAPRAVPGVPRAVWAGVVAATAALAVHSGFDFLWHVPAIPMTAGALIGLVTPAARTRTEHTTVPAGGTREDQ